MTASYPDQLIWYSYIILPMQRVQCSLPVPESKCTEDFKWHQALLTQMILAL